jgi:hypothetical protein
MVVDQKGGLPTYVFQKKGFRTICGPKLKNGVYMRSEDLSQKAIFIARQRGTRWVNERTARARPLEPQIGRTELRIERNGKNFIDNCKLVVAPDK